MKKTLLFLLFILIALSDQKAVAQGSLTVFDEILFFDGYAGVVSAPTPPEGVIRHRNDLYAKKLTEDQLASFGNSMTINVTIKASCDNYDRIGNVNLALVPKGATTYNPNDVQRIELARFITPFMNKNIMPDEVPYTYTVDNVSAIFKDAAINAAYDIWAELEVFGVPYAANTQVAGCSGRNDVFFGTLEFVSSLGPALPSNTYLLPLNFKKDLNNYATGATDVIGQTVRTINFNLPATVLDANFYLITSNHGSNTGGEEYNRRFHYIYLDNSQILSYKPGESTCEPYRVYNTQGNGIYGSSPRTPAQWQSFSNWCPGSVIPIRTISLGTLAAGNHTFKITVPDAVFVDAQGYIPVSLYLQGRTLGILNTNDLAPMVYSLSPNPTNDIVNIQSEQEIKNFKVFNMIGQEVQRGNSRQIDISSANTGIYLVQIEFQNNQIITQKIVKN